ncbi:slipin family protein [Candidatus Woesearchaeota archaeon]|nr:slipin family protein [Candidatus Woesearchaeota archaeon]
MAIFSGLGVLILILIVIVMSLKVVNEYERGVRFTLGKYTGMMQPGLRLVIPIIQSWERVDMRVKAVDVPDQDAITKDNVSISVNAVLYYKVKSAEKVILEVEHFMYAVSQLAQTTMRDVVGEVTLDELLSNRDEISKRIREIVDKATDPWGIDVSSVELKHIELPKDLQRVMGKEAEAEREKRAVIIKAEGEVLASNNMAKAATKLSTAEGALHLRTLQSINDLSSDQSNTVIFAVPLEVLRALERIGKKK